MTDVVAWTSVVASGVLFLAGLFELVASWRTNSQVRTAADKAAKLGGDVNENFGTLEQHAGIDFKGQWEALAALATALKDLDRSTRLLLLSLAFMAVAAATVGLENVGEGLASH